MYKYTHWFNANLQGHFCDRHGNVLTLQGERAPNSPRENKLLLRAGNTKAVLVRHHCYQNAHLSTRQWELQLGRCSFISLFV